MRTTGGPSPSSDATQSSVPSDARTVLDVNPTTALCPPALGLPMMAGGGRLVGVTEDFYCDEALSGRTLVKIVVETDDVLAFHHTKPNWQVHIVVVPKQHVPSLTDLGPPTQRSS